MNRQASEIVEVVVLRKCCPKDKEPEKVGEGEEEEEEKRARHRGVIYVWMSFASHTESIKSLKVIAKNSRLLVFVTPGEEID